MRIGSLCSGYGGLDLGLMAAVGGSVAWHVEYDKHPSAVLDARFPGVPNYGDVTTTDWSQVEPVDWLTAGYPCQPFSKAGKRKGSSDERHLWPDVARAIGVLRPGRILLENVAGHLSLGLDAVLGDLAALGYDAVWGVVRASDAGAPHERARVFIVATDTRRERHGSRQDGRSLGRLDSANAREASERQRARTLAGHRGSTAAAPVPNCPRREGLPTGARDAGTDAAGGGEGTLDWRRYTHAIRHWEDVLGRRAPAPGRPGRTDLNEAFVEWMMGLGAGWVTDVLPRRPAIKALGNGVVPQQAALAIRTLLAQIPRDGTVLDQHPQGVHEVGAEAVVAELASDIESVGPERIGDADVA